MNNKYLVLIPARGGSKGVKKKNIYPINGKPMIQYTIDLLKEIECVDRIVISTEDYEIKSVSSELIKGDSRFMLIDRPQEYAKDESSTEDVAFHVIDYMKEKYNETYDAIITMAPNLPLRTKELVLDCIHTFESRDKRFDTLMTFVRTDEDMFLEGKNGEFKRLFPNAPRRRQDREPLYIETSVVIITDMDMLTEEKSLFGKHVLGYVVPETIGIDVHDENDILYLEYLLKQNT